MSSKVNLKELVPQGLIEMIPTETAINYRVLPLERNNGSIRLAADDGMDSNQVSDIAFILNKQVKVESWPEAEIDQALKHFYDYQENNEENVETEYKVLDSTPPPIARTNDQLEESSIIDIVNSIISKAIHQHASDIHVEPFEAFVKVRYRIDGALHTRNELSVHLKNALISRIKIMADLDIAERRRPQDGRIRVTNGEKKIDLRVSTLPTDFGEKVVLRILDKGVLSLDLTKIGIEPTELQYFKEAVASPYGMILVTGPTGSGKTTTLYATLNYLNSERSNILTIEDPIEYNLEGINQSQLKSDIGYTFSSALKTFLRQDPDVIMVGEIRDVETAETAVRAALTGHLVLSTLHTNDAATTITRFIDMGVAPFLVASCVKLIVAQRLVRTICKHCFTETSEMQSHAHSSEFAEIEKFYIGTGCKYCHDTGFTGRTALFEVMSMNEETQNLVIQSASAQEIKQAAIKAGMKTLRQSGIEKIKQGLTTIDEVLRET